MGNPFDKEPAIIGAAVVAVLNALVLLQVINLEETQIAGINIALVAVLGLFVRQSVFSKDTTQKIANAATYQEAGTVVDIGNPPQGE